MTGKHSLDSRLQAALDAQEQAGLRRRLEAARAGDGPHRQREGKPVLSFASNDYLGLKQDPRVVAAFKRGADRFGAGAGASHLLGGHSVEHAALEAELADWLGRPGVLLFGSGYQAAIGTLAALLTRHDRVYQDRLNHACLLDGAQLARARLLRYPHLDTAALDARLREPPAHGAGASWVVSDSVFSMDGDLAPLADLAAVCAAHAAHLMVDEAHALGVLGPHGAGAVAQAGLDVQAVPVLMATFGKALGTAGACIAGSSVLREFLLGHARSFIYSTALPAALAAATREAVRIARQEAWRREHLHALTAHLRVGLTQLDYTLLPSTTPIQPVIVGDAAAATRLAGALLEHGIEVPAIRPPTVPNGSARLRISLSAAHRVADVDRLLDACAAARSTCTPRGLHIECHGDAGPDLVLLHGWGLHGGIFHGLVEALATRARVWVVDLPGHGWSQTAEVPLTPTAVIAAIRARVPAAHWFGWSLGGLIALQAALDHPDAIHSLTLCAATPCFVQRPHWPEGMPDSAFESFARDLESDWRGTLDRFLVLETLGAAEPMRELHLLRERAAERPAPTPQALQRGLGLLAELDLSAAVAQLQVPSLWLGGQRDRVVSPAALQRAAAATPAAQVHLVARAGHAPFLTHAAEVAEVVLRRMEVWT